MFTDSGVKCWSISKENNYHVIKLTGILNHEALSEVENEIQEIFKSGSVQHIIINAEALSDLPANWVRSFIQHQKTISTLEKKIKLVSLNPSIILNLKEQGVYQSLTYSPNMHQALVDLGLASSKKTFDVAFVNPFLTATMKVLEIQASTKSTPGKISIKEDKSKYMGDISGVIGMVSDSFTGSVVISFPEDTFLKIMSRMLGENYTEINKEIQDGAAEITNMIFGQAKIILNEKGYGLKTAIPSVVTGRNHSVQNLSDGPQVLIPFETDVGNFYIEICTSS
jgi:chemotaxis protein CheX